MNCGLEKPSDATMVSCAKVVPATNNRTGRAIFFNCIFMCFVFSVCEKPCIIENINTSEILNKIQQFINFYVQYVIFQTIEYANIRII